MTRLKILGSLVGAALAIALAGCGDNSAECGDGTHEEDGLCLPDATCGEGTIEGPDGECIPDGSVICEQGTVFDAAAGGCVPSEDACADGTVLIDGQCVADDDALTADHEEMAEPNDGALDSDGIAGDFDLPAIGAPGVVIHGCIDPYRDLDVNGNPDPDEDLWFVTTTGPALIEITADGVGGLAAGFIMLPGAANQVGLSDGGWVRLGVNLTGDTSERQVYLPYAGAYALVMADSRSIFLTDGAAGSDEACYYTTVRQVALPTPIPVTPNTPQSGTVGGNSIFYSFDALDGSIVIATDEIVAEAALGSLVSVRNGAFDAYGAPASGTVSEVMTGGMFAADTQLFVVEPIYNYALNPVSYGFNVYAPAVAPLPEDGSDVVVTNGTQADDLLTYVDVAAGEVVRFELDTNGQFIEIIFWGPGFYNEFVAGSPDADFLDGWVKFPSAGRYHVGFTSYAAPAGLPTITVTSTVTHVTPTVITHGTPIVDAPLGATDNRWFTYDPGAEPWVSFGASGDDTWGFDDVTVDFLDLAGTGLIQDDNNNGNGDWFPDMGVLLREHYPVGGGAFGLITAGLPLDFLVHVYDFVDRTATATTEFGLDFRDRDFTDLGTLVAGTPLASDALTIPAGAGAQDLLFLRGSPGDKVTFTVTPVTATLNLRIRRLNLLEGIVATTNATIVNQPETMALVEIPEVGWIALAIEDTVGLGGTYDLDVTGIPPLPYADICAGQTNVLAQTPVDPLAAQGDEAITAVQTLPFNFNLFGTTPLTNFYVSTNGFLSFQAPQNNAFSSNGAMGAATPVDPNGLIAPYWDNLTAVVICKTQTASTVTVQWRGATLAAEGIQMQAVLHSDGSIDYIYGAAHTATGSSATIGAENQAGTAGITFVQDQPALVSPSSRTFTTVPPT